jgi:hypothetical protein
MSRRADVTRAIDYMLKRRQTFTGFLQDDRICLTNNATERVLRDIALGRKSWLFAGCDLGGQLRRAAIYLLMVTARLNNVDSQAWLLTCLAGSAITPVSRLDQLLPWNWRTDDAAAA